MHELSLAGGIVELVEAAARRERFGRVSRLRLEAGALAGVEVRSLRFALQSIVAGTCLENAEITSTLPSAMARYMKVGLYDFSSANLSP